MPGASTSGFSVQQQKGDTTMSLVPKPISRRNVLAVAAAGGFLTRRTLADAQTVELALLGACGERPGSRHAAEQRDEPAAIAHQILPAAAFPHFPTRKLFVDMPQRLDVPLQWFVGHFPVLCDFVTLSMTATRSNAAER